MELIKQANGNLPRGEEEKKAMINDAAIHYGRFLTALGFDWEADENSKDTPMRVAKAWVNDLISGCMNPPPNVTTFPTTYKGIVFEGNIEVNSMCSHHNLPFIGKAFIGYIPGERVVGLSKMNRFVEWCSRRPQIQEGLVEQIHQELNKVLIGNRGIIVMIMAEHTCCSLRGVKHDSVMGTPTVSGFFEENKDGCKDEFYKLVDYSLKWK
jgi:GTP cyclohydrolase I